MSTKFRWSKDQLYHSPSRRDGISPNREQFYRQDCAYIINEISKLLLVKVLTMNTAIMYIQRFYQFHSYAKFHRHEMCAAALLVACKETESIRRMKHVIDVMNFVLNKHKKPELKPSVIQHQIEHLAINESIILITFGFDLTIDDPHAHVVKTCTIVNASQDITQAAYYLASNAIHLTTMLLEYSPQVVAYFSIHLACKWTQWQLQKSSDGREWYTYMDASVTLELLDRMTSEFLVIFDKVPVHLKKLGRHRTTSKGEKTPVQNYESRTPTNGNARPKPNNITLPDISSTDHNGRIQSKPSATIKPRMVLEPIEQNLPEVRPSSRSESELIAVTHNQNEVYMQSQKRPLEEDHSVYKPVEKLPKLDPSLTVVPVFASVPDNIFENVPMSPQRHAPALAHKILDQIIQSVIDEPIIDQPVVNDLIVEESVVEEEVIKHVNNHIIENHVAAPEDHVFVEPIIHGPVFHEHVAEPPVIEEPFLADVPIGNGLVDEIAHESRSERKSKKKDKKKDKKRKRHEHDRISTLPNTIDETVHLLINQEPDIPSALPVSESNPEQSSAHMDIDSNDENAQHSDTKKRKKDKKKNKKSDREKDVDREERRRLRKEKKMRKAQQSDESTGDAVMVAPIKIKISCGKVETTA